METITSGIAAVWAALGGAAERAEGVRLTGRGDGLPSCFAVGELATASVAAVALAIAELVDLSRASDGAAAVHVDRVNVAASFRAEANLAWVPSRSPTEVWDALAGDYRTADGWIRLHTNYAHHRTAALAALGLSDAAAAGGSSAVDRAAVDAAVSARGADELEAAVVAAGGAAAALRTEADWARHPQGVALAAAPLVAIDVGPPGQRTGGAVPPGWAPASHRASTGSGAPLAGIRVLDLTRVIAGPVATGYLAAYGADVIRIDPVGFDEVPALLPLTTAGKRCLRLDLRAPSDRSRFDELVAGADVVVSGLRPGALPALGYATDQLRDRNPALIVTNLDAYGWSGPWSGRRGFDSLVQMSVGIADRRRVGPDDPPLPLPAQALDHATGYLAAAATVRALHRLLVDGTATTSHLSLAATAELLTGLSGPTSEMTGRSLTGDEVDSWRETVPTGWGTCDACAGRERWPARPGGGPTGRAVGLS